MRRILVSGLGVALLFGVVGCGSAGVETGTPGDLTPGAPPDPKAADMTGRSGAAAAIKAAKKSSEAQAAANAGAAPSPEKK